MRNIGMDENKLARTLLRIIRLLVDAQYDNLEQFCRKGGLTAQQLQKAVEAWPFRLVMPDSNVLEALVYGEIVEVGNSNPTRWSVYVNLWSQEEGRSDLTLQLTAFDGHNDYYDAQIDDIHVL